jgi:hypothetical protein
METIHKNQRGDGQQKVVRRGRSVAGKLILQKKEDGAVRGLQEPVQPVPQLDEREV